MDKFQEMRSFAAVVEAGSFVAAAEATGLSKATGPEGAESVRVSACIHTNNGDTCRAAALRA